MSTYRPVKYVIFDMDGLLINTEVINFKVFKEILGRYGKTYTNEMRLKVMGTVSKDTYTTFINEYHLPCTYDEFFEEVTSKLFKATRNVELMPGAERLVDHLLKHSVPVAVATSSSKESFDAKKKHEAFFEKFNHIVFGSSDCEVKKGKPAPDVFLVCAGRFAENPRPEDCLVFEDAPNGVQAALAAGMQVVMVPDPVVPEEKSRQATKVISSLLDFKPEEFGLPKFKIMI